MRPYLGVSCFVFNALNSAFSAPRIWTVEAGCLAYKISQNIMKPVLKTIHFSYNTLPQADKLTCLLKLYQWYKLSDTFTTDNIVMFFSFTNMQI